MTRWLVVLLVALVTWLTVEGVKELRAGDAPAVECEHGAISAIGPDGHGGYTTSGVGVHPVRLGGESGSREAREQVIAWLRETGRLSDVVGETLEERVERAVAHAEGALLGTHRMRRIWDDADFLTAILAILTGDSDRARRAALAEYARRPV